MTGFEQLKALLCIIPTTQKEAEKIQDAIEKFLQLHPEVEEAFRSYVKRSVKLERNFTVDEHGTIKFK